MTERLIMPAKKKSFTKQFEELEAITEWFESEDALDLEKGLKEFEEGLKLAQELKEQLSEVENKVEKIKEKFNALDE